MSSVWRRRPVAAFAVATVALSGTTIAVASTRASSAPFRTTTVRVGDVSQLLNLTGTISVVNHASVGFPVAGTLATVSVHVGDTVRAGQVLAALATAPLTDAITQANASLAQAQATLQSDQAAAAAASPTPSASPATGVASDGKSHTSPGGIGTLGAQRAVAQAQARATRAMTQAVQQLTASQSACGASPTPTDGATPGTSPSASPSATPTPTPTPTGRRGTATGAGDCASAQAAALSALQSLARDQQAVERAQQGLTTLLAAAVTSGSASSAGTSSSARSTSVSSSSSGSRTPSGGQGGQSPAARATLDAAAVVTAQAALDAANRNLAGATLTSPIAGTIATQPFTPGSNEAVGTSITIIGPGAVQVTADVPETSMLLVKTGQPASVTANGATVPVAGTVTQIGMLPVTLNNGSNAYPVVIGVPLPSKAFVSGAEAAVTVVVKSVTGVLAVPDSAVSLTRGRAFVTVLTSGKPVRTPVTVGAIGALLTQVTAGVRAGQLLLLADPGQALPASSATLPTIRQFGGSGRAGFRGGGPGAGRPGG